MTAFAQANGTVILSDFGNSDSLHKMAFIVDHLWKERKERSDVSSDATVARWFEIQHACGWMNQALQNESVSGISALERARCQWMANDFSGAIGNFERAVVDHEADAEYLKLCIKAVEMDGLSSSADAHAAARDWKTATEDLTKILQAQPGNLAARTERCGVYDQNGQEPQAVEDCTAVLQANPRCTLCYTYRGDAFLRMRQLNKAISDFMTAGKKNDSDAIYGLACALSLRSATYPKDVDGQRKRQQDLEIAMEALRLAVKGGFNDWSWMSKDSDLDNLHGDPRFRSLLQNHQTH